MNTFSVIILGSSSATPTTERNPTAQLLRCNNAQYLIDCGEGTQLALRRNHISFRKINQIFISHLHGDHYFGLIGLVSTMHLLERTDALSIFGPPELEDIIMTQLQVSQTELMYPLNFHKTQANTVEKIFEDKHLEVHSFPLLHRIPTTGFLFREKAKERHIRHELIQEMNISFADIKKIKAGEDFVFQGKVIDNKILTTDALPSKSYAFCSDTAYSEDIIPIIYGVDMLYHETTFANDKERDAKEKYHSTSSQAALIAKKAEVKKMLIGHFSARYDDVSILLNEAREIFMETFIAEEGEKFDV